MTPDAAAAALAALPEAREQASWGERAFFVNPGARLPRGTYFATIKLADGPNDAASALGGGRWRLNLGIPKPLYLACFGQPPKRPAAGGVVTGPWDFTSADRVTPHPVYGWMGWVAVVSPSAATFAGLADWIAAAHDRALGAARCRIAKLDRISCVGKTA
jgi:hypothetical protein